MSRAVKVLLASPPVLLAACLTACGTQKLGVPSSDPTHAGAVLFSQRCSGCHTLSYAATHGSSSNARTREITNGPNFNTRCERPVTRVLYAIENGGFSGAIMPQNVVVGADAIAVAEFVAKYAGRQTPTQQGGTPCSQVPIGSVPTLASAATSTTPTTTTTKHAAGAKQKTQKKRP